MNVLLIGSGGREHALAWKMAQSSSLEKLYIAPGNAGTQDCGENVNLNPLEFKEVKKFVLDKHIHLVVVGPEAPLVAGIADFFRADPTLAHIGVVGPDKLCAQLEGSKDFAKQFMKRHRIPTARYETFTFSSLENGYRFLESLDAPYVLKADGLAAGKGVLILPTLQEAKQALAEMLGGQFGEASAKVVIEEFLSGIELSYFIVTDGLSYKILPSAKDYKRIGVGDTGPNTGGMGAVSPVPFADDAFLQKVEDRIVKPTMKGLVEEGMDYRGFIFVGLIKVGDDPFVIEYNCRMGDPETEVVMPRVKSDLLELLNAVAQRSLSEQDVHFDSRYAVTTMLVSGGYPDKYEKGKSISGLASAVDCMVFHAGTRQLGNELLTDGGRVIAVTAMSAVLNEAVVKSQKGAEVISFEGKYYRTDIGQDVMK